MQTIRLTSGLGKKGTSHCVMAATSIVAEEEFTDKPKCVCPTITSALIFLNESYDDDVEREEALGHLPWLIIGTRGDRNHERERAFLFADWAVRECCGIECEPITDRETALDAHVVAVRIANAAFAPGAVYPDDAVAATEAAYAASYATRATRAIDIYASAASAAADAAKHANRRQDLITYIESIIIPVYTTMPIEPGFRNECLISS